VIAWIRLFVQALAPENFVGHPTRESLTIIAFLIIPFVSLTVEAWRIPEQLLRNVPLVLVFILAHFNSM
jgi:hypothetical protein